MLPAGDIEDGGNEATDSEATDSEASDNEARGNEDDSRLILQIMEAKMIGCTHLVTGL